MTSELFAKCMIDLGYLLCALMVVIGAVIMFAAMMICEEIRKLREAIKPETKKSWLESTPTLTFNGVCPMD